MVYEDFTTYTENDGDIEKTETKADFITMRRDSGAYLYKDYGAGHFGDFEILFTLRLTDAEAGDPSDRHWGNVVALTDGIGSRKDNDNDTFFLALTQRSNYDDWVRFQLTQKEDGVQFDADLDDSRPAIATRYMTMKRDGTSGTLKIYSDAARTNLVVTLSITCNTTTYQYLHAIQAGEWDSDVTDHITGYVEKLDLQEIFSFSTQTRLVGVVSLPYSVKTRLIGTAVTPYAVKVRHTGATFFPYSLKARHVGVVRSPYSVKTRLIGTAVTPYAVKVRLAGTVIYHRLVRLMGTVVYPYSVKYRHEGEVFQWWHYRMPVTVTEQAGGTYAQYPTIVTVPWDAHMAADFSDCRFTEQDGQSIIPHGIVQKTDGVTCDFVILRDYTPALVHNLYLYYGSPGAPDTSIDHEWWAHSWYMRQGIGRYSSAYTNRWCNDYPRIATGFIPAWAGVMFGGVHFDGAHRGPFYGRAKINGFPVAWSSIEVCNGQSHSKLLRWGKFNGSDEQYDHPQFVAGGQNTFRWGHYSGPNPGWRCSWYPVEPSVVLGAEEAGVWLFESAWVRLTGAVSSSYSVTVRLAGNVGYGVRVRTIGKVASFYDKSVRLDGAVAGHYSGLVRLFGLIGLPYGARARNAGIVYRTYSEKARLTGVVYRTYSEKARLTGFVYRTYGARVRNIGVTTLPYQQTARTIGYACPEICRVAYTTMHSELEVR